MSRAGFEIAGQSLQLVAPPGSLESTQSRWSAFSSAKPPRWTVELLLQPQEAPAARRSICSFERGERGEPVVRSDSFEARVDRDTGRVEVRSGDPEYSVEMIAKLLLADALLEQGGLLVHGVGVAAAGCAALFTGPSGAGKSTLASQCQRGGLLVLADELVAVGPSPNGFHAMGTPWNFGAPGAFPLALMGTLGWSGKPRLESLDPANVLRTLLQNALLPWDTPECRSRLFHAASSLLQTVPVRRLDFPQEPLAATRIARVLEGALT